MGPRSLGIPTAAHGGIVAGNDTRLANARTPTVHAASHGSGQADAVTVAQTQVTNLVSDLSTKSNLSGGNTVTGSQSFAGNILLPHVAGLSTARNISWGQGYGNAALTLFDGGSAGSRYGWGLQPDEMQFFVPSDTRHFSWCVGGDLQQAGTNELVRITGTGYLGIGTIDPRSRLHVVGLPVYANNAAAIAAGLTAGAFYRTGADPDPVMVVH